MGISKSNKEGHVTALVFSGRKNPGWTIPPGQLNELLSTWEKATTVSHYNPAPAVLGYNGLLLQQNNKQWHVVNQLIYYKLNDELLLVKEDTGDLFEKGILQSAPADVLDLLEQMRR